MSLPGPPALPFAAGRHPRPGGGVRCWWRGLSPSGQSLPFRLNYPGALSCWFAHTPLPPRDGDVGGGFGRGEAQGLQVSSRGCGPGRHFRCCGVRSSRKWTGSAPSPLYPAPCAAALRRPLLAVMWGWTRTPWMGMKTGPAALKSSLGTPPSARTRWLSG